MGASIPQRSSARGDDAGTMMPGEAASPEAPPDRAEGRKQRDVTRRAAFSRTRRHGAMPRAGMSTGSGSAGVPPLQPRSKQHARPPRAATRRVAPAGSGREAGEPRAGRGAAGADDEAKAGSWHRERPLKGHA